MTVLVLPQTKGSAFLPIYSPNLSPLAQRSGEESWQLGRNLTGLLGTEVLSWSWNRGINLFVMPGSHFSDGKDRTLKARIPFSSPLMELGALKPSMLWLQKILVFILEQPSVRQGSGSGHSQHIQCFPGWAIQQFWWVGWGRGSSITRTILQIQYTPRSFSCATAEKSVGNGIITAYKGSCFNQVDCSYKGREERGGKKTCVDFKQNPKPSQ